MSQRIPTGDAMSKLAAANFYVEKDETYIYVRKSSNALPDRLLILRDSVSLKRVKEFIRRGNFA